MIPNYIWNELSASNKRWLSHCNPEYLASLNLHEDQYRILDLYRNSNTQIQEPQILKLISCITDPIDRDNAFTRLSEHERDLYSRYLSDRQRESIRRSIEPNMIGDSFIGIDNLFDDETVTHHGMRIPETIVPIDLGELVVNENVIDVLHDEEINQSQGNNILTISPSDANTFWSGCIGILKGKIILVNEFYGPTIRVSYRPISKSGHLSESKEEIATTDLEFPIPITGLVNHKDYVISVERNHKIGNPSRYRRGLTRDRLKIKNICVNEHNSLGIVADISNYRTDNSIYIAIHSIFNQKLFTYEGALKSILDNERLATAFNSSMCIKMDFNLNRILLLKYNWPIATYNKRYSIFETYTSTFNSELKKLNIPFREAK